MFRTFLLNIALILLTIINLNCAENDKTNYGKKMSDEKKYLTKATFGSGCFWCTEAIFENVNGVMDVVSGYSGGKVFNPTYEQVCSGTTGHAEVVQLTYDSAVVSYDELLEIFWKTHDPTTLNRQGADIGTQYRSVIFYHNDEQKEKAKYYRDKLNKEGIWNNPIVTEISPIENFFEAEKYHQNYYENNPNQGYCSFVITPKLEKFKKIFKDKLK
ncbi:MAG TPA: peptide-methionine (S)-S-oxide reductase [Bacteroidetes bacterium]|nr:peptide-methionine (S)-S-oxide reductase [Bacteroidota bacterium]